ncbi:hypothetical protein GCM10010913_48870 [Paenibacillus aceti]|uniref:Uncharacterized protein n=1 Tax=Paenibacillus aceti TaxID=1820010 RepID=A0ABQ1WBH7_9BACL|nr:hypothetical protein GCM10010913_48870 [Paenibacillus aceti]
MNIFSVLHCEIRKIIRANVFWLEFLVFAFGPIMMESELFYPVTPVASIGKCI